ncbi:MAG: trehalase family glycosidase [Saonia sp.]
MVFCLAGYASSCGQINFPVPANEFEIAKIEPVKIKMLAGDHYFIDFGKAYFGTVELVSKIEQQDSLIIHLGEKLLEENQIDRNPGATIRYQKITLNVLKANDTVLIDLPPNIKNTSPPAVQLPKSFGVIMPFRYVEIENLKIPIEDLQIFQKVFHYRFNDEASYFESSDKVLDAIWDLCKHTIKATSFSGFYLDGDRERLPYEADAYINQLSHYAVDSIYSMARRTNAYFLENPTWPTEWLLHTVMLFYQDFMYTGDLAVLENNYEVLKLKTLMGLEREDGLISSSSEKMTPILIKELGFKKPSTKIKDIVDWPPSQKDTGWKLKTEAGERDGYEMMPINTVVNAFYYHNLRIMAKIASILENQKEVEFWTTKAEKVKKTINEKLFDQTKGIYIDGEGSTHSALHANMFPLAFDLVPKEHVNTVVNSIKSRGMACSVYGSQYLLEGLFKNGEADYAMQLITDATTDRSWWNMIQVGSTMTMEAWDIVYKPNLDWNHAWGTAPANIITRHLWGITPKKPGFKIATIHPQMADLSFSKIKVPTINGCIVGKFRKVGDEQIFQITLPDQMEAEFFIPKNTLRVKLNGKLIDRNSDGFLMITSGLNTIILNQ